MLVGAQEHNLKNIDAEIPLGLFTCVTGVSGSGKSTLIEDILHRALARHFYRARVIPGTEEASQPLFSRPYTQTTSDPPGASMLRIRAFARCTVCTHAGVLREGAPCPMCGSATRA